MDWQGTLRAFLTNTTSGQVEQGASTLNQQYVKNYQLLVLATTDAERRAAIETTPARKIREIRMALTLDRQLTKDEILTRYLNLVPFATHPRNPRRSPNLLRHRRQRPVRHAAAMLAGMVQSSSALNPYTNVDGVTARRNVVLDTMIENIPERADDVRAAKTQPLGVLAEPNTLPRGCIAAGDRGFFCDYALQYLAQAGISGEEIDKGGYLIRTTLEPDVQDSVKTALVRNTRPDVDGAATVMNVVAPGQDQHRILAMGSSRTYGLDAEASETVQPQPYSLVGNGAGSIFKIFTAAAAMEKGLGSSSVLQVPRRVEVKGLGDGGAQGCPPSTYCVENTGNYPAALPLTDALAQSPNTAFVKLLESVGSPRQWRWPYGSDFAPTTSRAPRGKASRAWPKSKSSRTWARSPSDRPRSTPLELSNVAATLASSGKWCPPTPIDSVLDREGAPVPMAVQGCEQVIDPGLANTLANAMSKDDQPGGTAAAAAASARWSLPMSGKNRNYRGESVLRFPRIHQPLRRCGVHVRRFADSECTLFLPPAALRIR